MVQLLNYFATHPDAVIGYKQRDMILAIHSDASYLSNTKVHSRSGMHFLFLTNKPKLGQPLMNNVAVHVVSTIIRNVISLAEEANLAALYLNAKYGVVIRNMLEEKGHPQPSTPLHTENSTAEGIVDINIVQRRSKPIDMRFNGLLDQGGQQHFQVYWAPISRNIGKFHTKHRQAAHHRVVRVIYLHIKAKKIQEQGIQRGCVYPEGPRTTYVAVFITELLKSTWLQMRILRVNTCGNVFKYVPHIDMWTQ